VEVVHTTRSDNKAGMAFPPCALLAFHYDHVDVVQWLNLNEALSPTDDGVMDNTMMRNDLNPEIGDNYQNVAANSTSVGTTFCSNP